MSIGLSQKKFINCGEAKLVECPTKGIHDHKYPSKPLLTARMTIAAVSLTTSKILCYKKPSMKKHLDLAKDRGCNVAPQEILKCTAQNLPHGSIF